MIYIVCDANCNNFGNYFEVVGLEIDVVKDKDGFELGSTHYPKVHCYRARGPLHVTYPNGDVNGKDIKYSEAIDYLLPEDYVRWKKTRFSVKGADYELFKSGKSKGTK